MKFAAQFSGLSALLFVLTSLQMLILWFLIGLFTGSNDSEQNRTEAWIVAGGATLVGLLTYLLAGKELWPLSLVAQLGALYLMVSKVCETDQRTTLTICGSHALICVLAGLACYYLLRWPEPELR